MFRSPEDSQQYFPIMLMAHVLLTVVPTYMIYLAVQPMPVGVVIKQIVGSGILVLLLGVVTAFLYRNAAR